MQFTTSIMIILIGLVAPAVVRAATSVVNNSVQMYSNTGGNVSSGGVVTEGKSESSVSVTTVINGEVVESYEHTTQGQPVEYTRTVSEGDAEVNTHVRVETNTGAVKETAPSNMRVENTSVISTEKVNEERAALEETVSANPDPAGVEIISSEAVPQEMAESVITKVFAFVSNVFSYVFGWL